MRRLRLGGRCDERAERAEQQREREEETGAASCGDTPGRGG